MHYRDYINLEFDYTKYLIKINTGDIIAQDNKRKNTLLCKRFYCIFNYVIIIAGVAQLVEQLICNQ